MKLYHYKGKDTIEIGIDEAGRGCLAGPVVAAAVIFPKESELLMNAGIKDSKKLSLKKRVAIREVIKEHALAYAVSFVDKDTIDKYNILQATYIAMHNCLKSLEGNFNRIIVDGNRFPIYENKNNVLIPHDCIVSGDDTYLSIAAASILAKTYRDDYIDSLCIKHPRLDVLYEWKKNKCYGTKAHRDGLLEHGITPLHRLSFKTSTQVSINKEFEMEDFEMDNFECPGTTSYVNPDFDRLLNITQTREI